MNVMKRSVWFYFWSSCCATRLLRINSGSFITCSWTRVRLEGRPVLRGGELVALRITGVDCRFGGSSWTWLLSPPPDSRFPYLKLLYCESSHYWFLPFRLARGSFKRKTKKAGVSLCSKEEVKGPGETFFCFLNDRRATLKLSVCECETYILYTLDLKENNNKKKRNILMFSSCNSDFGAKTNVYLQCLFSRNENEY